jgi:PKD repeat protein
MQLKHLVLLAISWLGLMLAPGCVNQGAAALGAAARPTPSAQFLPSLPAPGEVHTRAASAAMVLQGSAFDTAVLPPHRASVTGVDDALFQPAWLNNHVSGPDDLAYALYTFPWNGKYGFGEAVCAWVGAVPLDRCWIGLGNFDKQRWDWIQAVDGVKARVTDISSYISPTNTVLVLVLLIGEAPATLNCISFNVFSVAQLSLLSEPAAGEGSQTDPFQQNVHETVFFMLFSIPECKEVSAHPLTTWVVTPPAAGTVVPLLSRASLHIADGFTGPFSVGAVYDGYPSEPDKIYFTAVAGTQTDNVLPDAILYADPVNGAPPLSVTFDARDSNDTDGYITAYRFDFDGDGTYDLEGAERNPTHQFATAGAYQAKLQVVDDRGGTDTETMQISVLNPIATWRFTKVRERLDGDRSLVGQYCDVWDVGGFPALAYSDFSEVGQSDRLHYIRAADANGATWGDPVQLQMVQWDSESVGINVQLRMIAGHPAVAYCEHHWDGSQWEFLLDYERAVDTLGADWSNYRYLADPTTGGVRGLHCQLIDIGGVPGISYFDGLAQTLLWTTGADADGASFSTPLVLDTPAGGSGTYSCGEYNSLALIDGRPAISYLARVSDISVGNKLMYIRASDVLGAAWGAPTMILQAPNIAQGTSLLELAGGLPGILFENYNASDQALLTFVSGDAANGGAWTPGFNLMTTSSDNYFPQLHTVMYNGKPAMASILEAGWMSTTDTLYFSRATTAGGGAWEGAAEIADTGEGCEMSLCLVAGKPALCYYDSAAEALWFGMYY